MIDQLSPADVRTGDVYETVRLEVRRRLSSLQSDRRVVLAGEIALVFENGETVRAALEEFIRVERRADAHSVAEAVTAFGALLPPTPGLLATLHLDIADAAALADRSVALEDVPSALWLDVAGRRVLAEVAPEEGLRAGATSVVFRLDAAHRSAWAAGGPVTALLEHSTLRASTQLTARQLAAIGTDLDR